MVGRDKRSNQKFLRGGYKQYRSPLVFNNQKNKPKREWSFPKINLKYYFYLVVILLALFFIFFSGKFAIKDVLVEGSHLVPTEKIASYVEKNSNILLFSSSKIRNQILSENKEIKEVEIIRGIPDAVKIVVLEHDNKMIWQTGGNRYLVSIQGVVTRKINEGETFNYPTVSDSKNIPVNLGDHLISPNFIAFVNNVYDKFFETTNIKPTNFDVAETTFDLNLHTEAGFFVKLNTMRSSIKQLENLKKVLVEKRGDIHEYVDLRIDGWAYIK